MPQTAPTAQTGFRLKLDGGPRDGQIIRIKSSKCTIGTSEECTLRVVCPGIEPVHAMLLRGTHGMAVKALASGTELNGQPFEDAVVQPHDVLTVGPLRFEVLPTTDHDQAVIPTAAQFDEQDATAYDEPSADSAPQTPPAADHLAAQRELESREQSLLDQQAELERQSQELQSQLEGLNTSRSNLDRQLQDVELREQTVNSLQVELDRRQQDLDAQQQAINSSEAAIDGNAQNAVAREQECEARQAELDNRQTELEQRLATWEAERAQTENELQQLKTSLQAEREAWTEQRQQEEQRLSEFAASLQRQEQEVESKLLAASAAGTDAQSSNAALAELQSSYEAQQEQWEQARHDLQTQLASSRAELQQQEELLSSVKRELEAAREEIGQSSSTEADQALIAELQARCETLEATSQDTATLDAEKQAWAVQRDTEQQRLESLAAKVAQDTELVEQQRQELSQQQQVDTSQAGELQAQLEVLQAEKAQSDSTWQAQLDERSQQIESLSAQVNSLQQDVEQSQTVDNEQSATLVQREQEVAQREQQLELATTELAAQQQQLADTQQQLTQEREQLTNAESMASANDAAELEAEREQLAEQRARYEQLESQLNQRSAEIDDKAAQVEEQKAEVQRVMLDAEAESERIREREERCQELLAPQDEQSPSNEEQYATQPNYDQTESQATASELETPSYLNDETVNNVSIEIDEQPAEEQSMSLLDLFAQRPEIDQEAEAEAPSFLVTNDTADDTTTHQQPDESPSYLESTYEEPAYEEPTYEEPAYDAPSNEQPAYEASSYNEPAASNDALTAKPEEDGSIDDYMAALMKRLGREDGGSPSDFAPPPSPAEPSINVEVPSLVEEETVEEPTMLRASEFLPRAVAPEATSNLRELRAVANTSTRSAIDQHQRKRAQQMAWLFWGVCGILVAMFLSLTYLAFLNNELLSISTFGAVAALIGTAVCAFLAISKSAKARFGSPSDNSSDKSAGAETASPQTPGEAEVMPQQSMQAPPQATEMPLNQPVMPYEQMLQAAAMPPQQQVVPQQSHMYAQGGPPQMPGQTPQHGQVHQQMGNPLPGHQQTTPQHMMPPQEHQQAMPQSFPQQPSPQQPSPQQPSPQQSFPQQAMPGQPHPPMYPQHAVSQQPTPVQAGMQPPAGAIQQPQPTTAAQQPNAATQTTAQELLQRMSQL